MLDAARVVLDLDVGHGMRAAFVTNEQTITLRVIAAVLGLGVHADQPTIGVLGMARADPLGHDARAGILAQMNHLGAGIGLLIVVGDGDGIEFALAVIAAQDAGRVFPRHGRAGFHLRPHHLGPIAPAIGALGHKIIDPALAVLIARIPVLHRGIFHLGVFLDDDLDHSGVQLAGVALGRGAAFEIADIRPLVGDDQRALKLSRILGIDPEIGAQFHRATHAGRHIDERTV